MKSYFLLTNYWKVAIEDGAEQNRITSTDLRQRGFQAPKDSCFREGVEKQGF